MARRSTPRPSSGRRLLGAVDLLGRRLGISRSRRSPLHLMESVADSSTPEVEDIILALQVVPAAHVDVDRAEHRLISMARAEGVSWAVIAKALGLHSRQAAEQRYLRLTPVTSSTGTAEVAERDPRAVRTARLVSQQKQLVLKEHFHELYALATAILEDSSDAPERWDGASEGDGLAFRTRLSIMRRTVQTSPTPIEALYDLLIGITRITDQPRNRHLDGLPPEIREGFTYLAELQSHLALLGVQPTTSEDESGKTWHRFTTSAPRTGTSHAVDGPG